MSVNHLYIDKLVLPTSAFEFSSPGVRSEGAEDYNDTSRGGYLVRMAEHTKIRIDDYN